MKKLKLIFWIIGILLVICSGSYFFGFAGTRFTEKLWAVGTEEDYLVFPENRKNILYQSGKDYYLKCEKRTYHTGMNNGGFSVSRNGKQPNLGGRINLAAFLRFKERVAAVTARFG